MIVKSDNGNSLNDWPNNKNDDSSPGDSIQKYKRENNESKIESKVGENFSSAISKLKPGDVSKKTDSSYNSAGSGARPIKGKWQ